MSCQLDSCSILYICYTVTHPFIRFYPESQACFFFCQVFCIFVTRWHRKRKAYELFGSHQKTYIMKNRYADKIYNEFLFLIKSSAFLSHVPFGQYFTPYPSFSYSFDFFPVIVKFCISDDNSVLSDF